MSIKKKAVVLSFVGATVLSLGLQSQQTFANTYANRGSKNYSYRSHRKNPGNHSKHRHYYDWCEDIITKPTPKPDPKPETKPDPKPETKPDPKPETKPDPKPETKPDPKPETKPDPKPEVDTSINAFETRVVELTNVERAKQGLPALKMDNALSKVAKLKSQDMQSKGYFDHNSPTYGSPFDMMKQFGISYRSAGENIAKGQRTPEAVVNAWMNSEGHRKNIMGNFTHMGVGYVDNGSVWTQMFISK